MVRCLQRSHRVALDHELAWRCALPSPSPPVWFRPPLCATRAPQRRVVLHARAPQRPIAALADPNLDSPLNGHAASIWNNVAEYKKALTKHRASHAAKSS